MRIVCISDTHLLHKKIEVPAGDVLIHAGDFCNYGNFVDLIGFNEWLGTLPHKHKLITAGNHDRCTQEDLSHARVMLSNATLLIDEEFTIDGVRFYFSPWSPTFGSWNWMAPRGTSIAAKWAKIPDGLDVLVTHGPPAGVLDGVPRLSRTGEWEIENVGCQDLWNRVADTRPRYHIFGHIHEGYGMLRGPTTYVNAAICDGQYRPVNAPIVLEVEPLATTVKAAA